MNSLRNAGCGIFLLLLAFNDFPQTNASETQGSTLKFNEALSRMLERSTQIGLQEQTLHSVTAANAPTRLFMIPTLSVGAKSISFGTISTPSAQRTNQVELQAGVNLFKFGADILTLKAALNDEDQQESLLKLTRIQAEDQAVQALITAIQRRLERDVLSQQVQVRQEALTIARERFERGFLSEQEVQKVEIDLENAKSRATEGSLNSYQADANLKDLLGSTEVETVWPWKKKFLEWNVDEFLKAHPLELSRRPDWNAATFHLSAEDDRSSRNYRLLLPSFDASLVYGYYKYDYYSGSPSGPAWATTLSVSMPLFDRLTTLSNARSESAIYKQAEIQKTEIERAAAAQYESARESLRLIIHSATDREATLLKSKNLYKDSLRRFQNGRSDTNELLIDQTRALDAELLAISGWGEAHTALSTFCHDLGLKLPECFP